MGLREQARQDAHAILNDPAGFSWPVSVVNPEGAILALRGLSNDVEQTIDPDTGLAVSGRRASVALHLDDVEAFGMPIGVQDPASKPWVVRFDDILCHAHEFKVRKAYPDRTLGIMTCELETYRSV